MAQAETAPEVRYRIYIPSDTVSTLQEVKGGTNPDMTEFAEGWDQEFTALANTFVGTKAGPRNTYEIRWNRVGAGEEHIGVETRTYILVRTT